MDLNDIALDPGGFTGNFPDKDGIAGNLQQQKPVKTGIEKAAEFINEYHIHYWIIVFGILAIAGELGYFAYLRNKLK